MNFVNSYTPLLVLCAVAGLSYGILNQASTKGIMYWFTSKFRATALGLKQSGVTVGGAINGVVLVALASTFHWHMAVLLVGILCLIMTIVGFILYRERPSQSAGESAPEPSSKSASKSHPKQKGRLRAVLRRPELVLSLLVTPFLAGGQAGFAAHWPLYLVENAGFTQEFAGTCFIVSMVVGTVARPGWGLFSDRVLRGDRVKAIIITCVMAFLGSIGAVPLPSLGAPIWLAFIAAAFIGAGFFGFHGVLMAFIAEIAGTELVGSVSGIFVTVMWIGMVTIPTVYGLISDHWGYAWCWALAAIFAATGAIAYAVFLIRGRGTPSGA